MKLEKLLKQMIEVHASDIFIVAGLPMTYESEGKQYRFSGDPLTPAKTEEIIRAIYAVANRDIKPFEESHNLDDDFSFALPGVGRFRTNVFRQRGSLSAVIRVIPFSLPTPQEYNIPPEVMRISDFQKGLVLVTGPAGSGKSTTLACIIDKLNHERVGHIITMEDPIEFIHKHDNCIVTQREIPTDIATYEAALKSAVRESPDILLLGEMRDQNTIATAVTAAEMAQLIFSTLHTTGAANTIDRIIDAFPANQQQQIRFQLSMVLQAVVSQQLIPTVDGELLPAFEIMIANTAIRNLIREEKTHQMDSVIAASGLAGMRTMDQSLFNLVASGRVLPEVALQRSIHQEALQNRLAKAGLLTNAQPLQRAVPLQAPMAYSDEATTTSIPASINHAATVDVTEAANERATEIANMVDVPTGENPEEIMVAPQMSQTQIPQPSIPQPQMPPQTGYYQ